MILINGNMYPFSEIFLPTSKLIIDTKREQQTNRKVKH